ncbi:MAG TPA: hypothetical protein VK072_01435 [Candidatus Avamphibacillus sp.]|nr:hypothetical protein [Candidatus Avamphibacillus sp.]
MNQYKSYLSNLEKSNSVDRSTFSLVELKLDDETFKDFQKDLNDLLMKYYKDKSKNIEEDATMRTIGLTIIPET